MCANPTIPSVQDIVRSFKSGKLLFELSQRHIGVDDKSLFLERCVALHNRGKISFLDVVKTPEFTELGTAKFFVVQQVYCQAIPKLMASARDIMACCKALVEKGGSDLAASLPNEAFRGWCRNNPRKVATIIRCAKTGDALARTFLTFALESPKLVSAAIEFTNDYSDDRRVAGVVALGRIKYQSVGYARKAISALRAHVANRVEDHLRANALLATLDVLKRFPELGPDEVSGIVKAAADESGPETLVALARALFNHHQILDDDSVQAAFSALMKIDTSHQHMIHEIDVSLCALLGTVYESRAIDFVVALLSMPSHALGISDFQNFGHQLVTGDADRLYKVLVRWLVSGSRQTCNGLAALLASVDQSWSFDAIVGTLSLTPEQQIFLCQKAIGFLFLKPALVSSILVSVLRGCEGEVTETVKALLFDPVLINYGGKAKAYLEGIRAHDPAHDAVRHALDRHKEYLGRLQRMGTIKELHPSEYQHDAERHRIQDEMRMAHKKAEAQSVLLSFVRRSVILYGRRSLTYVVDPTQRRRPVEMDLKSIGTSMEVPSMEIVDPVGLELLLRIFRVRRLQP